MNISIRALLEKMEEEELFLISDHADKEEESRSESSCTNIGSILWCG